MVKIKLFAVLTVALFGVALASPLAAQTSVLKAAVPFEFSFAGKTMPAGEYLIQADSSSGVLTLKSYDANASAVSLGVPVSGRTVWTAESKITFNRYGGTYFLASAVNGSTGAGIQIPMTRTERELARTASAQKYEILAVMARR